MPRTTAAIIFQTRQLIESVRFNTNCTTNYVCG